MNFLVSYEWLKEYVKLKETPDEFARRMSLSGPAVEKIMPAHALEGVVVGHVREMLLHPNADKLRLAKVDVGKKCALNIVCGGSNLRADQWVAVALIGSKVRWHGEGDLVELKPTEIRGIKSEGMICAANEIGLADAFPHEAREILDLGAELGGEVELKPGAPLAEALGLGSDVIMDMEVTTNRVDVMGMVGMAREAAAILDRPFVWKPASMVKPTLKKRTGDASSLAVKVSARSLCPRYMAVRLDGVKVGPSPWWLKRRLMAAGLNSINNVVDITNYVLLELSQPMHAFDAAKLGDTIVVREARGGEKIMALDGKDYELDDSILVIADATRPVAVAGVMGGEETGISNETTSIILEAATFDPVSVRRTSRKLNLQSDSQLRFEKGLSSEAPPIALARAVELVRELAGGEVTSAVVDARQGKYSPQSFSTSSDEVNALMGVALGQREMAAILKRLGFGVKTPGKTLKTTVPWWRDRDIELAQDLVEEIARVYGYGNIPPVVPVGLAARPMESELLWEDRLREIAKGAGLTEVYAYSFVSKELMAKAGYQALGMLHLQNPLSEDMAAMRTTLLPSLLQVASDNRERESEMSLFEVANVYYPKKGDLPDENLELGALFLGMSDAWKVAKGFVEHALSEMGIGNVKWQRLESDSFWHPGRAAQAFADGTLMATLGEINPRLAANFKLERVAMVDMPLKNVLPLATAGKRYTPLPAYPPAKRDLAVIVLSAVEYAELSRAILQAEPLVTRLEWFDTYRGKNLPDDKKSVAMHLELSSPERTLSSSEVDKAIEVIIKHLQKEFGAEVRQ